MFGDVWCLTSYPQKRLGNRKKSYAPATDWVDAPSIGIEKIKRPHSTPRKPKEKETIYNPWC
jgi:hypothetical protein